MTDDERMDIAALLDASIPGPWAAERRSIWSESGRSVALASEQADADLIVWMRDHIDRLLAIAEWAQDAPHHDGCLARHNDDPNDPPRNPYRCKCGRDEVMP